MFALIVNGQLYLKVDAQSRAVFEAEGLQPFVYEAKGRRVAVSYFTAPVDIFDDPACAAQWAERAWQAALRAPQRKVSTKKRPRRASASA